MTEKRTLLSLHRHKRLRKRYDSWLATLLYNNYVKHGETHFSSYTEYSNKCLFKLDMTFDRHRIKRRKAELEVADNSYDVEHDNFLFLYRYIVQKLYGKRYSRPFNVAKAPYVIACIDFENSRMASSFTLGNQNAHIHSVWAIRPEDVESFQTTIEHIEFKLRFLNRLDADNARFERFDRSRGTPTDMASYGIKSQLKSTMSGLGEELLRIYPNANRSPNGKTYKASGKYVLWSRSLERIGRQISNEIVSLRQERQPWERTPEPLRTTDVNKFLAAETLITADLESARQMLATLDGMNSGPYRMRKGNGVEPTIVKGATSNSLTIRRDEEFEALRTGVEQLAVGLRKIDP